MEEESSVAVEVGPRVFMVDQHYDETDVRLCALEAKTVSEELTAIEHGDARWIHVRDLSSLDLAPADIILARGMTMRVRGGGSV